MSTSRRPRPSEITFTADDIAAHRLIAAMGYFWIFCMVPLVIKKNSPFAQFHAKQGIVLAFAWFLAFLVSWLPLFNILIAFPAIIFLGTVNILVVIRTFHGRTWKIPLLYRYVETIGL